MVDPKLEAQFDALAVQVQDWIESAVALDEGHFPNEMLHELTDLIDELKAIIDEPDGEYSRKDVMELFINPETAEVIDRFPRVRRQLERAWGAQLTELIEDEAVDFSTLDEDDEE